MRWNALPHGIRGFLTWLGIFGAVVVLKRDALLLPSSWDESWAVLPGGIWLSSNGFDILGLIRQPLHFDLGPGTYALAPVTWMTGLVAMMSDSTQGFLTALHLAHMAIGAVGLREVYRFARPVWSRYASATLVTVTALVPVMNAQLGFMYLEIPIFTCGMLAINAGLAGRWRRAAGWGALATSFKASGILPLGAIVASSFVLERTVASFRRSVLTMLPAIGVGLVPVIANEYLGLTDRDLGHLLWVSFLQIFRVPEIGVALLIVVILGVLPDRLGRSKDPNVRVRLDTTSSLLMVSLAFYVFTLTFVIRTFFLPRYFIMIVPFVLFSAWEVTTRSVGKRVATVGALLLLVSTIINSSGTYLLDPNEVTTVGLEASNAYAESLLLTRTVMDEALELGIPIYLSNNLWFRSQYPKLGYVDSPARNAYPVLELGIDNAPPTFAIVDSEEDGPVRDALAAFAASTEYSSIAFGFMRGDLTARYVVFKRASRDATAGTKPVTEKLVGWGTGK